MSNELNKNSIESEENVSEVKAVEEKKSKKPAAQKENFFKRIWKKFVKLCKDTVGEMKKVVWTPKTELVKNTKLVLLTVVAFSAAILVIDSVCAFIINTVAGLIG